MAGYSGGVVVSFVASQQKGFMKFLFLFHGGFPDALAAFYSPKILQLDVL